jgi:hypothetical protein
MASSAAGLPLASVLPNRAGFAVRACLQLLLQGGAVAGCGVLHDVLQNLLLTVQQLALVLAVRAAHHKRLQAGAEINRYVRFLGEKGILLQLLTGSELYCDNRRPVQY